MKPFRERNPVPIGIIGILTIAVLMVLAFNAANLPFLGGGGTTYQAAFSELGGLKVGNEVRIAGVKVGKVTDVALHGNEVIVHFKVDSGTDLGDQTRASIRIKTLLGQKYLALDPEGAGSLSTKTGIPLARTTAPFDVPQAFSQLSTTIDTIDTAQLAKSFETLSATFADTPPEVQSALTGLSRLSETVASRDTQLHELLAHARGVTGVLASRDAEVERLINDGNALLAAVSQRRESIHELLVNTSALSEQLIGLVRDNKAQLDPALAHLHAVVAILQKNQDNLDKAVELLAPFVRDFANTIGNGRWFDTIVSNLPPANPKFSPAGG